jgi:metallo-beta-lactamase class B
MHFIIKKTSLCLLTCIFTYCLGAQTKNNKLDISHLHGNFYIYTTYKTLEGGALFPSNSMYLVTDSGVALFDTPWDSTQFQALLDSIEKRHHKKVVLCISTHYHDDRTAGLEFFRQKGIRTYTSYQTYQLCLLHHEKQPAHYFVSDTTFTLGGHHFSTFYPGEGHTPDNIVVWFNNEKILYGGCLVKSTDNSGLGNIADANLIAWPVSIKRLTKQFPKPAYVIPGHFSWTNNKSLKHTLRLLKKN